jgi:hypothetical protein
MVRESLEEALLRDPELVESGKYATHLKAWRKALDVSRILVTFYERLRDDPQQYVDELAEFIGLAIQVDSRANQICTWLRGVNPATSLCFHTHRRGIGKPTQETAS